MESTIGLLEKIRHHDKVAVALNENCKISLPQEVMEILSKPHKLSFYYFQYIDEGKSTFKTDLTEFSAGDGDLVFGLPNQIFTKLPYDKSNQQYALSFDEHTLSLLPGSYPFLANTTNIHSISFDEASRQRIRNLLKGLFQLLHNPGKQQKVEVILAHLHTLMVEFNHAYFEQNPKQEIETNFKLSKYQEFRLRVEDNLSNHQDIKAIAEQLSLHSSTLYSIIKEHTGLSPKEWITNRLILEAQRKLEYSNPSVKELAYELGFTDPGYFSRVFRRNTGKSITRYLAERDSSRN
ncbi:AraC family transcriptional regulator [Pedobacter frigidisoli]|uniref:helix-turn-helix domain-containing protein n=1 Tax=Pedobacter frigidisoli TaxID=2530455 RepID=UPI00292FEC5C|nr:AraC family transcriptional regulator [Pedobacter frigidisoli]